MRNRGPVALRRIGSPQIEPRMITSRVRGPPAPPRNYRLLVAVPDRPLALPAPETRRLEPLRLQVLQEVLPRQRRHMAAMRTRHVIDPRVRARIGSADAARALDQRSRDPHDHGILEGLRPAFRKRLRITHIRHRELRQIVHDHQTPRRAREIGGRTRRHDAQRA